MSYILIRAGEWFKQTPNTKVCAVRKFDFGSSFDKHVFSFAVTSAAFHPQHQNRMNEGVRMSMQSAGGSCLWGSATPGFLVTKKERLAELKWGIVAVPKFVSVFFLPSEWKGGKKSYELFTRKVTLRGHGTEPAVSLPPPSLCLSFIIYLCSCNSLNAKTDTFILGLNL